jgi:hypothetical protein
MAKHRTYSKNLNGGAAQGEQLSCHGQLVLPGQCRPIAQATITHERQSVASPKGGWAMRLLAPFDISHFDYSYGPRREARRARHRQRGLQEHRNAAKLEE